MTEIENTPKPKIIIVVPAHNLRKVTRDGQEKYFLSPTGIERVLAAKTYEEHLRSQGHSTKVIFTGGQSDNPDIPRTSELMGGLYSELTGEVSHVLSDSNQTQGNIADLRNNLEGKNYQSDTQIHVISQRYHDFGGRFQRILNNTEIPFKMSFVPIEEIPSPNKLDLNFMPESFRFTSFAEVIQAMTIKTGFVIDKVFGTKFESGLYSAMTGLRNKSRS